MIKFYDDVEDFASNKANCNSWVATAIIGAGVVTAATTAYTSSKASDAQIASANQANQTLRDQYNQTRSDLMPYNEAGQAASTELQSRLPFLTSPITMDENKLKNTPINLS